MSSAKLNETSVAISWGKFKLGGEEHILHIKEDAMSFRLYSKMFFQGSPMLSTNDLVTILGDEDSVHLFYYVAVPSSNDAVEEDPNLYKGLIYYSFSKDVEFVDLGNIRPADGPPLQEQ